MTLKLWTAGTYRDQPLAHHLTSPRDKRNSTIWTSGPSSTRATCFLTSTAALLSPMRLECMGKEMACFLSKKLDLWNWLLNLNKSRGQATSSQATCLLTHQAIITVATLSYQIKWRQPNSPTKVVNQISRFYQPTNNLELTLTTALSILSNQIWTTAAIQEPLPTWNSSTWGPM